MIEKNTPIGLVANSLTFHVDDGLVLYMRYRNIRFYHSGLGFEFFASISQGIEFERIDGYRMRTAPLYFEKLCQSKTDEFTKIKTELELGNFPSLENPKPLVVVETKKSKSCLIQ